MDKALKKPNISYKQIFLTGKNINKFLKPQSREYGKYDAATNSVYVYRYNVPAKGFLTRRQRERVVPAIADVTHREPYTIAHNMHHWHNARVADLTIGNRPNYYAQTILYVLDELSANAAAILLDKTQAASRPVNMDDVADAVASAAEQFLEQGGRGQYYINAVVERFWDQAMDIFADQNMELDRHIVRICDAYHARPKSLYSQDFYRTVKHFFTFDGISALDAKNLSPYARARMKDGRRAFVAIKAMTDHAMSNALGYAIVAKQDAGYYGRCK